MSFRALCTIATATRARAGTVVVVSFREMILERDGDSCVWCRETRDPAELHVCHLVPRSVVIGNRLAVPTEGPRSSPWNALALCVPHHRRLDKLISSVAGAWLLVPADDDDGEPLRAEAFTVADDLIPQEIADAIERAFSIMFAGDGDEDWAPKLYREVIHETIPRPRTLPREVRRSIAERLLGLRAEARDPVALGLVSVAA